MLNPNEDIKITVCRKNGIWTIKVCKVTIAEDENFFKAITKLVAVFRFIKLVAV